MSDTVTALKNQILKGSLWMTASSIGLKVLSLCTVVLILSQLTPYEYGVVELTMGIMPIVSILLFPGLSTTIIADIASSLGNAKAHAKGLLKTFALLVVISALVLWGIVFFGAHVISAWYSEHVAGFLMIASGTLLVSPFRTVLSVLFSSTMHFREQAAVNFLEDAFKCAALLVFYFYGDLGIAEMLGIIVGAQAAATLILIPAAIMVYRKTFASVQTSAASLSEVLSRHALWGILNTYVGGTTPSIRLYIIKFMLGTEVAGLFALALGAFGHIVGIAPLYTVVGTVFARMKDNARQVASLFSSAVKYQLIIYAVVAAGVIIIIPPLVHQFLPEYVGAVPLIIAMLAMLIPSAADVFYPSLFAAYQAQRSQFFATVYKGALNLVLLPPSLFLFGEMGIVAGLVLVTVFYDIERFVSLRKFNPELTLNLKEFFHYSETDRFIVHKIVGKWLPWLA